MFFTENRKKSIINRAENIYLASVFLLRLYFIPEDEEKGLPVSCRLRLEPRGLKKRPLQMANMSEKSRGAAFAEQQLLRHGWEHGKGLGRAENGISEPIKVKVKCDKGGVGHREGEQFSFHWWDHVFNKASSSLQVQAHQDGIEVKKTTEEEEGGSISNRKPRKAALARDKLYGCFVKSATLLAGQEQPEPKMDDSSSSSSDEEEEQKLDLSSVNKLSDADLMKACGGRTAHKGARHGLTMSAKLARLEQQEAEFMARYGQRNQPERSPPVCVAESSPSPDEEVTKERRSKKKKKKKSAESCEDDVCSANDEEHQTKQKEKNAQERVHSPAAETLKEMCEPLTKVKKKKKKSKHHSELDEENPNPAELEEAEVTTTTKKSKKKKQKKEKQTNLNPADEEEAPPKKKKKKSKTAD
ncbi:G patch domain-containing protein 4 [Oryzias melastigma]|uniref:G patch domain-containing protein 4 n=1 Tax=Oryzias melastigma TaxID=30732 RepID=UPI00168CE427|nr:G patch domain-containing protein 4 [Oryzias melastigma]